MFLFYTPENIGSVIECEHWPDMGLVLTLGSLEKLVLDFGGGGRVTWIMKYANEKMITGFFSQMVFSFVQPARLINTKQYIGTSIYRSSTLESHIGI